ncbi:hypothetical protein [Orbus hercynius]|nr:hypothetical protein [Orbus hercynius]
MFLIALYPFIVFGNNKQPNIEPLMTSFIACDASFFSQIHKSQNELVDYGIVDDIHSEQTIITVKNRNNRNQNYREFSKPMSYKSLSITGYYDSVLKLGKYGDYYFWGFIVNNSVNEIKADLDFLTWQELEKDTIYSANAQIRYEKDDLTTWHQNSSTVSGVKTIPTKGTVEKILLVEKTPEKTLLICSIQGFLPPKLLSTIRPDLETDSLAN